MDPASISEQIEDLKELLEARLTYDQTKEDAFQRLYKELDEAKRTTLSDSLRPFFMDLILLYDRTKLQVQDAEARSAESDGGGTFIESLLQEIEEILFRRGIERVVDARSDFDAKVHRAVQVRPTDNAELDGQIVEVVRDGFVAFGRTVRPQEVIVAKYSASDSTTKSNNDQID